MKVYHEKEFKSLLCLLTLLFLLWCTPFANNSDMRMGLPSLIPQLAESVLISGVLSSGVFLCDLLLSGPMKNRILSFFVLPMPGETVFSRIQKGTIHDVRWLIEDAQARYRDILSALPQKLTDRRKYENAEWYRIYVAHKDAPQIVQTQKEFLLCRDTFAAVVIFGLLYLLFTVLCGDVVFFSWKFLASLVTIGVITNYAGQLRMRGFVHSVIAVDLGTSGKPGGYRSEASHD